MLGIRLQNISAECMCVCVEHSKFELVWILRAPNRPLSLPFCYENTPCLRQLCGLKPKLSNLSKLGEIFFSDII